MNAKQLIEWINTHHCGVEPAAVIENRQIVVRVECFNSSTGESAIEETPVETYAQARAALGY